MFLPIFLLGIFYGVYLPRFRDPRRHKLLGSAIASSILFLAPTRLKPPTSKIVGGNVMVLLVMSFLYVMAGRRFRHGLKRSGSRMRLAGRIVNHPDQGVPLLPAVADDLAA
jgi:peptidoglycan/LPS O-acetylase OafA/YrhL